MTENQIEQLRHKWTNWDPNKHTLQDGFAKPGAFYIRLYERGGFGPCEDSSDTICAFSSKQDAVACFRYLILPGLSEAISKYEPDTSLTQRIQSIENAADRILKQESIDDVVIEDFFKKFNMTFAETNPQNAVKYWGTFGGAMNTMVPRLQHLHNPDSIALLKAINSGLDDNNPAHRELAQQWVCNI